MVIRPMTVEDVVAAEAICADAFHQVDLAHERPGGGRPARRSPERSLQWTERTRRLVAESEGGCWVAEADGEMLGFATGFRRETTWFLATYAVRPDLQGRGIGRPLLEAAAAYGRDCGRWMLSASPDPRARRRYESLGFALHEQLALTGSVDRSALPGLTGIRDGRTDDLGWMDDLDRRLRGSAHGPDHGSLAESPLLVAADRSGYAYASRHHLSLLAAKDVPSAQRLLWACLAQADADFEAFHITEANRWALEIGTAAGLRTGRFGFLGLRGMEPPTPYIHNGALL